MFVSRQRNPTFSIDEFNQEKQKDVNNSKDVNMRSDDITLEETQMKIVKPLMYIDNRMDLENWLLQMNIYFVFNQGEKRQKTLFAITRMKRKIMK